ncbi:hypothetical protein Ancab_015044 [Ancistrocladus abbreviatus]
MHKQPHVPSRIPFQGAKSSSDVKAYIDTNGDTLEWGEFQIDGRSARGGPISGWDPSSFRVPDDLEQWVGEHFNKIFINADDQEGNNPAAQPSENNRYVLKPDVDRPQSLIIEGPSRVGKTAWARSLGKHNYLSGHLDFNSRVFSNDVDYNVIRDKVPQNAACSRVWSAKAEALI